LAANAVLERHVQGGGIHYIVGVAVSDDAAVRPGTEPGDRYVTMPLSLRNAIPGRHHGSQGICIQAVIAVQGNDEFALRLAHPAVEGCLLVLVLVPYVMYGEACLTLPFQHLCPRAVSGAVINNHPFEILPCLIA